eukprot:TRINITY_DN61615_c0_g2_i3.p1 TRINITY_DN61615_c0_g2~~TRINITY_DN61615_c0_g2_i3.p1  ORF type:complete len:725 (-),score=111.06 TRINITY_DN61615_c0_g2_i3:636-2810(-)
MEMVESPLKKQQQQHLQMLQQQQQQQCIQEVGGGQEEEREGEREIQPRLISSEEQKIIDFVNVPSETQQFNGLEVNLDNAQFKQKTKYIGGLDGLCTSNDLVEMLQTSVTDVAPKEGSPNVQSSNTTDSHFKTMTTTNPNISIEDVLNHDKFLDDLLLPDTPDLKMEDIIQKDELQPLQDLEHVPKMEDLEKFLISCDLISPEFTSQGQQSSMQLTYNQQQAQIVQQKPTEFVPVSEYTERAAKKLKQVASTPPAYKSVREVQGALTSTLQALDGQQLPSSTSNYFDNSIHMSSMRRSTSYPFPYAPPPPNLGLYSSPYISENSFQSMANRSASYESFRQQLPPLNRQLVPNLGSVSGFSQHCMQNQQLGNKVDYQNRIAYMSDMDGQVFFDPSTGRRMNPGPAFYKRQREEHGPNLQSIFQRFGNNLNRSSPNMMGFHLHPQRTMARHNSLEVLDGYGSLMSQRRVAGGMGGKGSGLVKEGVLDQIKSAGAQQWLKIDPNLHSGQFQYQHQQDAFISSQNRLIQGREIKQETPDVVDINRGANSCGIAQKVVTEATERGHNGRYSSGFTIESQLQRQMSGRIQYQGVSRDPWNVHFDAHVQDNQGQQQFLGGYASQVEAARARDVGQMFFNPENGTTNFPKSDYASVEELRELGPSGFVLEMQKYAAGVAQNDSKFLGVRKAGENQGYEAYFRDVEMPIYPNKQQQTATSVNDVDIKVEDSSL